MKFHHLAIVNRSEQEATRFYRHFLMLPLLYDFMVPAEQAGRLFSVNSEIKVLVFGAGEIKIEVFIMPEYPHISPPVPHFCFMADDPEKILGRAGQFEVQTIRGIDGKPVYLKDYSGNFIELKKSE